MAGLPGVPGYGYAAAYPFAGYGYPAGGMPMDAHAAAAAAAAAQAQAQAQYGMIPGLAASGLQMSSVSDPAAQAAQMQMAMAAAAMGVVAADDDKDPNIFQPYAPFLRLCSVVVIVSIRFCVHVRTLCSKANASFNMNEILVANITASDYFKSLQ